MYFLFKMGIFHCYVCLPEGNSAIIPATGQFFWAWYDDPTTVGASSCSEKTLWNSIIIKAPIICSEHINTSMFHHVLKHIYELYHDYFYRYNIYICFIVFLFHAGFLDISCWYKQTYLAMSSVSRISHSSKCFSAFFQPLSPNKKQIRPSKQWTTNISNNTYVWV